MKKLLIVLAVLVVVGLSATAVVWTQSANTVGEVSVTPAFVVANEPSDVLFTARIDSALVIPTGVNLLKVDATGKTLAIAGTMRDNGTNGDALAGDKVFSLRVTLNEASVGDTYYRVSAAFRGTLRRELSSSVVIHIDPFLLPPDPGELGKLTLEGIDSDGDGVRDDVQRWIAITHVNRPAVVVTAITQLAQAYLLNSSVHDIISEPDALALSNRELDGLLCLAYSISIDVGLLDALNQRNDISHGLRILTKIILLS